MTNDTTYFEPITALPTEYDSGETLRHGHMRIFAMAERAISGAILAVDARAEMEAPADSVRGSAYATDSGSGRVRVAFRVDSRDSTCDERGHAD